MTMFQENIRKVLIPLVSRMQVLASETRRDLVDRLGVAVDALHRSIDLAQPPAAAASQRAPTMSENWIDLALDELARFNRNGVESICSVAECFWKTNGIMNVWHADGRGQFFFRGERSFDWDLESSAKRRGLVATRTSPFVETAEELAHLKEFQHRVGNDAGLRFEVFGTSAPPGHTDVSWWAHLQHFESGTRLLDITTSPFTALFFACADWDGAVDDRDGAYYLFPDTRVWRRQSDEVHIRKGSNVGPTDPVASTIEELFRVEKDPIRIWRSPTRNERLLAQDGLFLWAPAFDEPYNVGQRFKFRVSAEAKKDILRELYSIGYTAERLVRGKKGVQAHERICAAIGIRHDAV